MTDNENEWFKTWFDTTYYHILYQHRDFQEAEDFISNLLDYLSLPTSSNCLDLACGKGRHSIFLNQQGYSVTGVDLSSSSIAKAKPYETDTLSFDVHDMRKVYKEDAYDAIFNLFTSFGYFDQQDDNLNVLQSMYKMVHKDGQIVIDFMIADYALDHLVPYEEKILDGICFKISKRFDGTHIFKDIEFEDEGEDYHFQERVQAIRKDEFLDLMEQAGFNVKDVFGDFSLQPFDKKNSDRLILIAHKK